MKPCPVPACTRKAQDTHVMCGICWSQVSTKTQRAVYQAWSRYNKGTITLHDYLAVRQQAIDAVSPFHQVESEETHA